MVWHVATAPILLWRPIHPRFCLSLSLPATHPPTYPLLNVCRIVACYLQICLFGAKLNADTICGYEAGEFAKFSYQSYANCIILITLVANRGKLIQFEPIGFITPPAIHSGDANSRPMDSGLVKCASVGEFLK